MDNFDQKVKEAQQQYEIKSDFVDSTMNKIMNNKPKHRFSLKVWAPSLAGGLAVLAIILVALPGSGHKASTPGSIAFENSDKAIAKTNHTVQPDKTAPPANTASATSNSSTSNTATDSNSSLNNDINAVQNSINQEASDQSSVNSSLNDSQQEISVPVD